MHRNEKLLFSSNKGENLLFLLFKYIILNTALTSQNRQLIIDNNDSNDAFTIN